MFVSQVEDPSYFSKKPVDETTSQFVLSFISGLNYKIEDPPDRFLITQITKLQWLKTGAELKAPNKIFLETDLSGIPEDNPIVAAWSSSWYYQDRGYYATEAEKGFRYDGFFLLDAEGLEEACKSDNPQWLHLDYKQIGIASGNFMEIGLPEEGYQLYTQNVLSEFDYTSYDYVGNYKKSHPIIREYIDSQFSLYLEKNGDK